MDLLNWKFGGQGADGMEIFDFAILVFLAFALLGIGYVIGFLKGKNGRR